MRRAGDKKVIAVETLQRARDADWQTRSAIVVGRAVGYTAAVRFSPIERLGDALSGHRVPSERRASSTSRGISLRPPIFTVRSFPDAINL
jgi:hypothetical protein